MSTTGAEHMLSELIDAIHEGEVDSYAELVNIAIVNATIDAGQTPPEAIDTIDHFLVALSATRDALEDDIRQHDDDNEGPEDDLG